MGTVHFNETQNMKIGCSKQINEGECPRCGTRSDGNIWNSFLDASDIRKGSTFESLYCMWRMHRGACHLISLQHMNL